MIKLEKVIEHIEYLEGVLSRIDREIFLFQTGRQEADETIDKIHKLTEEASDID